MSTPYEQAEARIDVTPELQPYRDILLYDWREGDEHYNWVATAELEYIVEWADIQATMEAAERDRPA